MASQPSKNHRSLSRKCWCKCTQWNFVWVLKLSDGTLCFDTEQSPDSADLYIKREKWGLEKKPRDRALASYDLGTRFALSGPSPKYYNRKRKAGIFSNPWFAGISVYFSWNHPYIGRWEQCQGQRMGRPNVRWMVTFFETFAYTLFAGFVSLIVFLGKHLAARQWRRERRSRLWAVSSSPQASRAGGQA